MNQPHGYGLLRDLQRRRVAPHGEVVVDLERTADLGDASPAPVLLLTDAALYAARAGTKEWSRLPFERIRRITVHTDPTGMLTRYAIEDDAEQLWFAAALPLARPSFRERMHELAARLPSLRRPAAAPAAAVMSATSLARLASLATARSMASSAAMVSASSVTPVSGRGTDEARVA
jgi:hypothetical protein